jgi:hypothetical protein
MNKVAIFVALAVAGGLGYYLFSHRTPPKPPAPPPPPPAQVAPAAPPPPDAQAVPQIAHPIADEERGKLPGLDDSDAFMRETLGKLFGIKRLEDLFFLDGVIRRIVATVDNLPREHVAFGVWPVKPVPGDFLADGAGDGLTVSPRNAARYASRVQLAESVDVKKVAAIYRRLYPLFQRAYQDLGYPNGYFNDRLVEAIDDMLNTPEKLGAVRLSRPKVRYEFADADLARRSAGQKILLRMGPENAGRVKAVLRSLRSEVIGRKPR